MSSVPSVVKNPQHHTHEIQQQKIKGWQPVIPLSSLIKDHPPIRVLCAIRGQKSSTPPSRDSAAKNQGMATTDFTERTDKSQALIRVLCAIRGQKSSMSYTRTQTLDSHSGISRQHFILLLLISMTAGLSGSWRMPQMNGWHPSALGHCQCP